MADNVERVKIIRDQSFLLENKWSGVIIQWFTAHKNIRFIDELVDLSK